MNGVEIMKYNFVYDTDFLEKNSLYLSKEEMNIVLATVIGKHNAIFYGYQPERLVIAIKRLTSDYPFVEISNMDSIEKKLSESNDGILYTKDFDSWSIVDQQYLYAFSINDVGRSGQFIVTTINNPFDTVVPDLLNNFDIIYMCKGGEKNRYPKERLALNYRNILNFHQTLISGKHITSTELKLENYWLCNNAYYYLLKLSKDNPIIGRKVFTVSRSVSDCTLHNLTSIDDVHIAEGMCGAQRDIISELVEEM
jgi:hypothetical protein